MDHGWSDTGRLKDAPVRRGDCQSPRAPDAGVNNPRSCCRTWRKLPVVGPAKCNQKTGCLGGAAFWTEILWQVRRGDKTVPSPRGPARSREKQGCAGGGVFLPPPSEVAVPGHGSRLVRHRAPERRPSQAPIRRLSCGGQECPSWRSCVFLGSGEQRREVRHGDQKRSRFNGTRSNPSSPSTTRIN